MSSFLFFLLLQLKQNQLSLLNRFSYISCCLPNDRLNKGAVTMQWHLGIANQLWQSAARNMVMFILLPGHTLCPTGPQSVGQKHDIKVKSISKLA